MYTFTPIPPIDTINCHTGFYIVTVFMLLFFVIACATNDGEFNLSNVFIIFSVPCVIAAVISWNTGTYQEYANTPVTGTFVKFEAEGFRERSGKSHVDRHYTYVVYNINGNDVLFHSSAGIEYPKTAIFYKN